MVLGALSALEGGAPKQAALSGSLPAAFQALPGQDVQIPW